MSVPLKFGGVAEHFNLPIRLCLESGIVNGEWTDIHGGTGAIADALLQGKIDMATMLTEGAVTIMCDRDTNFKLHTIYVEAPLRWGVYVATDGPIKQLDDLANEKFAISRFGSGSELMTFLLAARQNWNW
jgi:sulfonate transport system substrate-binding protein